MLVVGYFTKDEVYSYHADLLSRSLDKFNICHDLVEIEAVGWLKATAYKPSFILDKLLEHKCPVLYVDVDAVAHSDFTEYFEGLNADLAVHYKGGKELLSGVLYFDYNDLTIGILKSWIKYLEDNPSVWDQVALQNVLNMNGSDCLKIVSLPVEYVYIFDTSKRDFPNVSPIIEHLQASRESGYNKRKKKIKYRFLSIFGISPSMNENLKARRKRLYELGSDYMIYFKD